jgi:hypothetical protein
VMKRLTFFQVCKSKCNHGILSQNSKMIPQEDTDIGMGPKRR